MGGTREPLVRQDPGTGTPGPTQVGPVASEPTSESTPSSPTHEAPASAGAQAGPGYSEVPPHAPAPGAATPVTSERLTELDRMLGQLNVPEGDVLSLLTELSGDEVDAVISDDRYRSSMLAALTQEEIARAVENMGVAFDVKLSWLLAAGTSFELVRTATLSATSAEFQAVLAHQPTVNGLKQQLGWHNFAKAVELMGQSAPDVATLMKNPQVIQALDEAWLRSNPGVRKVPMEEYIHEEGGWIYFNILNNSLSVQTKSGGPESTPLQMPPFVADSIVVATFHTHPNLGGETHKMVPSPSDEAQHLAWGVPGIVRTEVDGVYTLYAIDPPQRRHLAGDLTFRNSWSFPGPSGGQDPMSGGVDQSQDHGGETGRSGSDTATDTATDTGTDTGSGSDTGTASDIGG